MRKGISYWSFPGGLDGNMEVGRAMRLAKEAGFEGIELTFGPNDPIRPGAPADELAALLEAGREAGLAITSLATGMFWGTHFAQSASGAYEQAMINAVAMLEAASRLEVDTALMIPGSVDVFFEPQAEIISYDLVYARVEQAVRELLPVAARCRVAISIENVWNKFFLSPLEMRDFIDQFDSPWVGAYFDVGNAVLTGYPEQWIRILGPRIKKVHLKDFRRAVGTADGFVDLLEGDVDWPGVMQALMDVGYDGFLTAEMIPTYRYFPEARLFNTSCAMDYIMGRRRS